MNEQTQAGKSPLASQSNLSIAHVNEDQHRYIKDNSEIIKDQFIKGEHMENGIPAKEFLLVETRSIKESHKPRLYRVIHKNEHKAVLRLVKN